MTSQARPEGGAARERSMAKSGGPALDGHRPAVSVGRRRVLDPDDRIVELLGQLADLPAADDDALPLVGELADGRDDGRRPRAPHLSEGPIAGGARDLVRRDLALGDAEAPLAHECERRVARDAR